MPFTETAGAKLYWEEEGSGEPLLLIMGLGYTLEMWYRSRPSFAARYRTILFDNRGVGRSDVTPGPYPVARLAADASAVLDAAGADRAHVYGLSLGGMIAQELALAAPERVRSLTLGCTTCGGPELEPAAPEVLAALMTRGNLSPEEGVEIMVPYLYHPATPRSRIDEDLAIRRRTFPTPAGYYAQAQGATTFDAHARIGALTMPTLVIHGEDDRLVPASNGRVLARRIPGAELVLLPNASHVYPTDQPEASIAAVLDFIAAH
jgi:pimeloyl-ACP methyl ester carboxylesterase